MVGRVAAGASLSGELERLAENGAGTQPQRAALIDLTHGTLRRFGRVQAIARALSRRGRGDPLVEALLWCALYALESGRYADYTVVDQAVKACALLSRPSAKGFVNAVLRGYLRGRGALEARVAADPEARFQHPLWWIEMLRAAEPARWEDVLAAGNSHPPMCLRVNVRRSSVDAYRARLRAVGIAARSLGEAALLLERPVPAASLPGFAEGEVSVQDAGAQRAAVYLDLADGQRVLDACAAPGGKSAHLLEHTPGLDLLALDVAPERVARIRDTLGRLGLTAGVRCADATRPDDWWDGRAFDRILLDAPCSASGVIRHHPDVKLRRQAADLPRLQATQQALLESVWPLLKPGGKLLYVTCSVLPDENERPISHFLEHHPDAREWPLRLPAGRARRHGWQLLPFDVLSADTTSVPVDGFYYAGLVKTLKP